MPALDALAGIAGTAILQRTFLLETQTSSGIPRLIIVLDSVQEEEPSYETEITENAVEAGPEVTDHAQIKNNTLRLKGMISNTPLDLATSIANLASGALSLITDSQARANFLDSGVQQAAGAIGAAVMSGSSVSAGALLAGATDALARSAFLSAYQRKARFDVVTKRQRYKDMMIESMSFPRDSTTGDGLLFEINLKHIRVVSPQTVQIGTTSSSTSNSATSSTNMGNQAGTQVSSQTLAQAQTAQASSNFGPTQSAFKLGA